jgi:hypothetical protein
MLRELWKWLEDLCVRKCDLEVLERHMRDIRCDITFLLNARIRHDEAIREIRDALNRHITTQPQRPLEWNTKG